MNEQNKKLDIIKKGVPHHQRWSESSEISQ